MIDSTFNMTFTSGQFYETSEGIQRPCTRKQVTASVAAGAVDTNIISAVSGKKIRLLTLNILALTANSFFNINSKPAGAGVAVFKDIALYLNHNFWDVRDIGLVESIISEGITCTNGAGSNIEVSAVYIEYTPVL